MPFEHDPTTTILAWLASIGAGGVEEIAAACAISAPAARARLRALERAGLVRAERMLHGEPALHLSTRAGLRAAGRPELDPVRVSAASFAHALAVARVAVALGASGEGAINGEGGISGERELRALERAEGRLLASAEVGHGADGQPALHRPDLVCWTAAGPVAIEVELTVKAPRRLRAIVRAWARSRAVAGVVYYASPPALRAVRSAVRSEQAGERVAAWPLGDLDAPPLAGGAGSGPDRRVPSQVLRSVEPVTETAISRRQ